MAYRKDLESDFSLTARKVMVLMVDEVSEPVPCLP